ncbi:hypothetical protein N7456_009903 [Penicillium angulare]|uniref:C2H2-type domain-containing protein n=1 Tax=Penicillium angulare TaxID=116970 RepID=A0A9W9F5T0_9EURO|nr:hypothetical protein N7456_009903 [Penicillium angulare]
MSELASDNPHVERQFTCTYCQRTFRRLEHLQRHTRRHTNEKPFACRCGALFSRRDLLRRHERIVDHSVSSNAQAQPLDDDEQSVQSMDNSPSIALHDRVTGSNGIRQGQNCLAYQTPHSAGSLNSMHPNQTYSPLNNLYTPPMSQLVIQDAGLDLGHNEFSQGERNTHNFPTIFPSPQLSLATQIVPHCASPKVTLSDRSRLLLSLGRVGKLFPHPNLPSSNALTRYMAGYFTGFYSHCPFTHVPTFKLDSCSPELSLAMMALGAIDRFEFTSAVELFYLSKALLFDSQQHRARSTINRRIDSCTEELRLRRQSIDEVRCLLCLAHFASWQSDLSIRNEACILQSLLGQSLRSSGLEEPAQTVQYIDWEEWSQLESERRTKLFAFCFLGVQNIAYDMPPSIWGDEIDLKLPCSCAEWTAPDATTWGLMRGTRLNEQGKFNETLDRLLSISAQVDHNFAAPSPVGNYVLMHGLLHKILWTRRSLSGSLSRRLAKDFQSTLESALQKWTLSWQHTPESNLEPLDPNGPLPFTSSAFLSFAYVRNCFDTFQTRNIFTWAPAEIAQILQKSPPIERKQNTLLAAYHATNLLDTLVKLGVQYFKNNQAVLWNIEATLCGLDCSVFLEKWLRRVQETMQDAPLTEHETNLVSWIQEVVYEGLSSANDSSFNQTPRPTVLPDHIITVWSHIMQGNSPFPFIKMIGEVLVEYQRLSGRNES